MNQGNIYLRKDGRWEGRIVTGRKDGKRQYRAFFGRAREEAAGKMAEDCVERAKSNITELRKSRHLFQPLMWETISFLTIVIKFFLKYSVIT